MKLKRILPLLLSVFMVGSVFAGCGGMTDNDNVTDSNQTTDDGSSGNTTPETSETTTPETSETPNAEDDDDEETTTPSTEDDDDEETTTPSTSETPNAEDDDEEKTTTPSTEDDDGDEVDVSSLASTTVYLVGDSTVCSFSDAYYLPRYGYGTQIINYLYSEKVTINNLALSGRSSRSYLTESNYTTLCDSITTGDYLIIGFGHNDEKSGETFTDPTPNYQTATSSSGSVSFQYNLYENYIKVAEAKGATPILCTPIVRYNESNNYTGSSAHITDDGDYPAAIRKLAEDTGTALIDLTAITKADYTTLGTDAQNYHAFTKTKDGVRDGLDKTHLNKYGAKMVAYELATALKSIDCSLKNYVKSGITAPTYDADYQDAINTSYVEPDYTAFDAASNTSNALETDGWYKTAFGDIGGAGNVSKFTITESNGTFTVGNTDGKGKFASSSDGFAAAFMQVSVENNFTATVTVTVSSITTDSGIKLNQSGFGMMLRDDIYIDTYDAGITSTFAAAGFLGKDSALSNGALSMYAGFSRESASLKKSSTTASVSDGSSYTLTIKRENQTIYTTIAQGETTISTGEYPDLDLYEIDSEYMYLCLFANRGITVTYTDFNLTYNGTAQTA